MTDTEQTVPRTVADWPGLITEQLDAELAERIADGLAGYFDFGEGMGYAEREEAFRIGEHVARAYSGGRLIDAGDVRTLKRVAMVTDLDRLNDDQLDRLVRMSGDGAQGALVDPGHRLTAEDRAAIGRALVAFSALAERLGRAGDPEYRADAARLAALADGGAR